MRESVLDDAVFSCHSCGKRCNGQEIEMSATKLIQCSDCLNRTRDWSDLLQGME